MDIRDLAAHELPELNLPEAAVRVLIGSAFGVTSPVATLSPTLYLDIALASGGSLVLPDVAVERAVYSTDVDIELGGTPVPAGTLAVLEPGSQPLLHARQGARVVVIGSAPLGHRFIVWNFVSSRRERIVQAQDDWEAQRFDKVPGETEFTGTDAVWYTDLAGTWAVTDNVEFKLGVNNVFNKEAESYAPNVQSGTDPSTYDVVGRRVFGGIKLRF